MTDDPNSEAGWFDRSTDFLREQWDAIDNRPYNPIGYIASPTQIEGGHQDISLGFRTQVAYEIFHIARHASFLGQTHGDNYDLMRSIVDPITPSDEFNYSAAENGVAIGLGLGGLPGAVTLNPGLFALGGAAGAFVGPAVTVGAINTPQFIAQETIEHVLGDAPWKVLTDEMVSAVNLALEFGIPPDNIIQTLQGVERSLDEDLRGGSSTDLARSGEQTLVGQNIVFPDSDGFLFSTEAMRYYIDNDVDPEYKDLALNFLPLASQQYPHTDQLELIEADEGFNATGNLIDEISEFAQRMDMGGLVDVANREPGESSLEYKTEMDAFLENSDFAGVINEDDIRYMTAILRDASSSQGKYTSDEGHDARRGYMEALLVVKMDEIEERSLSLAATRDLEGSSPDPEVVAVPNANIPDSNI